MKKPAFRVEKDSLGERRIPAEAYYGVQTDRALENFKISGLRTHPVFIDTYAALKKAAALANHELGMLDAERKKAIVQACDEVRAGKFADQFAVDVYQMGAGTAVHMNVNEVIANRANEILTGKKGSDRVHPNDHVNMGQSTNDTYPTVMRLSAVRMAQIYLHGPLFDLEEAFFKKAKEFDKVLKSARTHLQDAVPIRLGQEFAAYGETIRRSHREIAGGLVGLLEVGMGGSAAGTGLNTVAGYAQLVTLRLGEILGLKLAVAPDLREAMQSQRAVTQLSAALRNLALEVTRITNDLRLLSSGPTTGLAEIDLPATAPGSSIMPGKVNPSILEMTNMVAFQVIGCDTTIAFAGQAGQLELNFSMPLMSFNLNFMIQIFGNALKTLDEMCIRGIKANVERCRAYAESSLGLATALNPVIGYSKAAEVAKEAMKTGKTVVEIIREKKILSNAEITKLMDPYAMTEPASPAGRPAPPAGKPVSKKRK